MGLDDHLVSRDDIYILLTLGDLLTNQHSSPGTSPRKSKKPTKSQFSTNPGTLLNERIAALEAEKAQWKSTSSAQPASNSPSSSSSSAPTTTKPVTGTSPEPPAGSSLRRDLATTIHQNTQLTARLRSATAERDRLLALTRSQSRDGALLAAENKSLARKVRDQAEELEGKRRLLDRMHDDVLALELNVSLVEQQKAKLAADNKDLVERWMSRVGLEADRMNAGNEKRGNGRS